MSWGDLFEDRPEVVEARARFWALTQQCTNLDWLILTKSPENIARLIPQEWHERGWPANIWLGVTAENQQYADLRIPLLAQFPAVVRFVSCEPLLGPIDLSAHLHAVDWVIVGGESGDDARPMRVEWARALRDQCVAAEKTLFFKQWGMHLQDGTGESLIQIRSKLSDHHLLDGVLHQAWPTPRSAPRESRNT
jgi:protein gp37